MGGSCLLPNGHSCQLYHCENKLHLTKCWWWPLWTRPQRLIFIVLAHWNNSSCVDMALHSETLSWFLLANPSLTRPKLEPTIYRNAVIYSFRRVHPRVVWGVRVAHLFNFCVVLLCLYVQSSVLWCPIMSLRSEFRVVMSFMISA